MVGFLLLLGGGCRLSKEQIRDAEIGYLTDQAVLADIAKNDKNKYMRSVAKSRLKHLERANR